MSQAQFITADGTTFDISGNFGTLMFGDDLAGWEWRSNATRFSREARTYSVELVAQTTTQREEVERLLTLADYDTERGLPDKLVIDDWYINCNIVEGGVSNWYAASRTWQLKLQAKNPIWYRERTISFMPQSASNEQLTGHDYPHDYPHDYGTSARGSQFENTSQTPCDFRLTVYGYAVNPSIYIAGNTYGVDTTVPDGGLLVIDSTKKRSMNRDSVVIKDKYGNATDAFKYRVRGIEGSGSYIFQRIPQGLHNVTWEQSWGFDLTLIERRAALPWI